MDRTQFEGFLTQYRPVLVLRAEQITGDHGLGEDVVQTTTEYLLKNLHRYNPDLAGLLTWTLEAVKRRAYNMVRDRARLVPLREDFSEEYGTTGSVVTDFEERLQGQLLGEMMGVIGASDPDHYWMAQDLLAGMTIAEIAEKRGVRRQTLEKNLVWSLKRWRKLLAKQFTKAEIAAALGR